MTVFDRMRDWFRAERTAREPDAPAETNDAPADDVAALADAKKKPDFVLDRLARIGREDGPSVDEAIALLRQVRGTPKEAEAVTRAMSGLGQRAVPEPIRVACADILAARGDEPGALALLEDTRSIAGLILRADLLASSGQLARAVGTIERVLARDLGAPGARERHQRWRASLGYDRGAARNVDEATVVAPQAKSGAYRLVRELARGGAGVVYEAEDEALGRKVAFKVLHSADGEAARDKPGEREARMTAALAGPGVVRVFDADPKEGWLALEWAPRGSVREALRAGDASVLLPIGRWARPLARAIARLHQSGVVHLDIKPANVLFRAPQEPVLADFGLARAAGAASGGGSPGYLSPERLAGRAADPRDDVYGFGRILEDVLHRLEEIAPSGPDFERWREIASTCIGGDAVCPRDGAELVQRLP